MGSARSCRSCSARRFRIRVRPLHAPRIARAHCPPRYCRRRRPVGDVARSHRPDRRPRQCHALALDRAHARRSRPCARGGARAAESVLHRLRRRRSLALHGLRFDVGAALRPRSHRLDRRDRGRTVGPERHLRRQRCGDHSPGLGHGAGALQVHRRGQVVDAHRPLRFADDRDDRRRRARPEPLLRRRARASVWTERGARHLPLARRRQDAREGALPRRVHERQRCAHRSVRSEHHLCHALAAAGSVLGRRRLQRRRQRHLQVHRRWQHVEAAHRRPAHRAAGEHRDCAEQCSAALRHGGLGDRNGRVGSRGVLHVGRRRRALDHGHRGRRECEHTRGRYGGRASARAHRRRRPAHARDRSEERAGGLQLEHRVLAHRGWRQELVGGARRARRRRLPESVDQPAASRDHSLGVGSGRRGVGQSRRVVEQLVHAADGGHVPRHHRLRLSLSRLQRTAGLGLGVRGQPLERWPYHLPRLAPGQHPGIRHRRA